MLDDGTAGRAEIKRRGGIAVVQDPTTAAFASMPNSAIHHVDVDHITPLSTIAPLLDKLTATDGSGAEMVEPLERKLTEMKCPECNGPIWELRQGRIVEYDCQVGHLYSPLSFANALDEGLERTLWDSLVCLEQSAKLADSLGDPLRAATNRQHAWLLRSILERDE